MIRQTKNQSGFTIIEILLAMAIFSFVMITVITAFTQIIRSYRKGVVSQRTQEATREIIDLISKEARVSTDVFVGTDVPAGVKLLCFKDGSQFEYNQTDHTLKQGTTIVGCNTHDVNAKSVVSEDLDVLRFKPQIKSTTKPITLGFNIDLLVATDNGPDSLISGDACDPLKAGSQFCSTSSLKTSIGLRGETP